MAQNCATENCTTELTQPFDSWGRYTFFLLCPCDFSAAPALRILQLCRKPRLFIWHDDATSSSILSESSSWPLSPPSTNLGFQCPSREIVLETLPTTNEQLPNSSPFPADYMKVAVLVCPTSSNIALLLIMWSPSSSR